MVARYVSFTLLSLATAAVLSIAVWMVLSTPAITQLFTQQTLPLTSTVQPQRPSLTLPGCKGLPNMPVVRPGELGSTQRPIVITFAPWGDTTEMAQIGQAIAGCLSSMTGLVYRSEVGTSATASVEAMGANKAQVGFLDTFAVVLAQTRYGVQPGLIALDQYYTVAIDPDKSLANMLEPFHKREFIARADSGIKSYADLKGKTICYVEPYAPSDEIIPSMMLKANGINPDRDFEAVVYTGSYDGVAIAVFKGACDVGVTFVDGLTDPAANYKQRYPTLPGTLAVFALTGQIPNGGVQFVANLDPNIKQATIAGLETMANDPEGNAVLNMLYPIKGFQEAGQNFYSDVDNILKQTGTDPASLVN